ncbi:thioredoxin F, chloroplastic-like [Phragmites australis]|uniref:thioredoxin F, chloroplastic-like n=1 Tax=Phragmites australis TaxID=29695 RepID=UPI002D78D4CA|nr:thioredoxin F, chloroplastic-like [Phragmites australis]
MALRLSISSSHGPASSPAISTCRPAACGRFPALLGSTAASQKRSLTVMTGSETRGVTPVRSSSLETTSAGSEAVTGTVTEVNKDTFWPIVKAAGEKVVVLDMYTQWCGPCKVMAPKFQEMSEKNLDVVFLKLDCNQDNRPLAKELGIRVVPTFKILKDGKVVKEVTGAKIDELVHAIEAVKSS